MYNYLYLYKKTCLTIIILHFGHVTGLGVYIGVAVGGVSLAVIVVIVLVLIWRGRYK